MPAVRRRVPFVRTRTVRAALSIGGTCLLAACAPLPPRSVGPSVSAAGAYGEDRLLVGSLSVVDAVAVSRRFVFAAGPGGVAVYDRIAERFLPPARELERELNGGAMGIAYAADTRAANFGVPISAMAGDPVEDAVWIGLPGAVLSYRPFTGQVQRTLVTGVPQRIVFERGGTGDALVLSAGQWTRISRVGITTPTSAPVASQVIVPPTLTELLDRYPGLRAQPQLLMRPQAANRPLTPFTVTAGAAAPDRANEVWLGTDGEGVFRVDPVFGQGTAFPYGLRDPGAGALAAAANGVWVAGLGLSARRGGLTFATVDLQRWRWIDGTIAVPLVGVRSHALVTRGNRAWLATDRGLVRVQLDGAQEMQAYTTLRGLPDDRVYAVAARDDGVWAGTARGLVFVSDSLGVGEPVLRDAPVYALQIAGGRLWAGSQRGLVMLPTAGGGARATLGDAPRAVTGDPALRTPVRALAAIDSVLMVATDDVVLLLDPRRDDTAGTARLLTLDPRLVGQVTRVAADDRALAVAGSDGVVLVSRSSGARRALRTPTDVPGPVLDVLLQRDFVFLATPQGLLRLRRSGDGLVP